MGVGKDHEKKKREHYGRRKAKIEEDGTAQAEVVNREVLENLIALNREKALPVEGYKPLFKELLKQYPIEKRY
jgi:hypothetical protein